MGGAAVISNRAVMKLLAILCLKWWLEKSLSHLLIFSLETFYVAIPNFNSFKKQNIYTQKIAT
jgi:hypothetical protein